MHIRDAFLWVVYRDPIDSMDYPSNLEIGLGWYKKGTNKEWIDNLTDHLMVDLETMITLANVTCIVVLDAYELNMGD